MSKKGKWGAKKRIKLGKSLKLKAMHKPKVEKQISFTKEYDPESIVANIWKCTHCGKDTCCVELAHGVTPFMIKCSHCNEGFAQSVFYPKFNHSRNFEVLNYATHEWYRPDSLDEIDPLEHNHVNKGGLLMRPKGNQFPIKQKDSTRGRELIKQFYQDGKGEPLTLALFLKVDKILKDESNARKTSNP